MKMMDEDEVNYVAVTFSSNRIRALDKTDESVIYDEVKTLKESTQTPDPHIREKEEKSECSLLLVVAVSLGIVCVASMTAVITVCVQLSAVNSMMSRLQAENLNLTAQNLQLKTQTEDLTRDLTQDRDLNRVLTRDLTRDRDLNRDLTRDRDRLNWTLGVILDHASFPVSKHCPHKVCKPCLDDWQLFQSNCYWFSASTYSSEWNNWEKSRKYCKEVGADLVVINSKEEQEFISNRTEFYNNSDRHGYWIGLKEETTWTWVDGSNVNETYWTNHQNNYASCALSLPKLNPQANWKEESCNMKNRWICETRALIRPD